MHEGSEDSHLEIGSPEVAERDLQPLSMLRNGHPLEPPSGSEAGEFRSQQSQRSQ